MTLRCVIVDDQPAVLCAARELLEAQGIAVVGLATNSDEALSVMEEAEPDVMLVDIDLGRDSGLELARRISRSVQGARPCVILTSTHDEADYADLIAVSPAIGFLPKPDLSATAIRQLVALRADRDANGRRGTR